MLHNDFMFFGACALVAFVAFVLGRSVLRKQDLKHAQEKARIDLKIADDFLAIATTEQKAKAFDLLLEYHTQCSKEYLEEQDMNLIWGTQHRDQICRMTTYLRAVIENHWMIEGDELVMYYDIWEAQE